MFLLADVDISNPPLPAVAVIERGVGRGRGEGRGRGRGEGRDEHVDVVRVLAWTTVKNHNTFYGIKTPIFPFHQLWD
jgi:hypothetical protein